MFNILTFSTAETVVPLPPLGLSVTSHEVVEKLVEAEVNARFWRGEK